MNMCEYSKEGNWKGCTRPREGEKERKEGDGGRGNGDSSQSSQKPY